MWNTDPAGGGSWLEDVDAGGFADDLDPADVLCANGKTDILLNVDFTCARISTVAEGTGAAGGGFEVNLTTARAITCDVLAGTTTCLTVITAATNRLTVTGNVTGGGTASARGIYTAAYACKIDVVGNVTGGGATAAYGIYSVGTAGNPTVTGNVTAGVASAIFVNSVSTDTITVTGDVTASSTASGLVFLGLTVKIVGNLIHASNGTVPVLWSNNAGSAWKLQWNGTATSLGMTVYDSTSGSHFLGAGAGGTTNVTAFIFED